LLKIYTQYILGVSDELFYQLLSMVDITDVQSVNNTWYDRYYKMWYDLYGIRDMRYIWFDHNTSPTVIELVLQVKEVTDVDLSSETFHMDAVLDIEWIE